MKCTLTLFAFLIFALDVSAQLITLRFANPNTDCGSSSVCYEIQANSNVPGVGLDELNMRMYIDDAQLTFIDFRNPDPNYFLETTGTSSTGVNGAGQAFFGFTGNFVYIIDNLKRLGNASTEIGTGGTWTRLFEACFNSSSLINPPTNEFCPSLILDHDTDGSGFASGSDGVEVLAVDPAGGPGVSLDEAVIHTNWFYYAPDITLGECAPICLIPVDVSSLGIDVLNCDKIKITWKTETEINNEKFVLYRRYTNNPVWEEIGVLAGAGTSGFANYYQIFDESNIRANIRVYYKIVQIDFDGTENTLPILTAELNCETEDVLELFPNPAVKYTNVRFNVNVEEMEVVFDIIDMSGKVIRESVIEASYQNGTHIETLNVENFATGQYLLRARRGNQIQTIPFDVVE